jgi:hypothetical protein
VYAPAVPCACSWLAFLHLICSSISISNIILFFVVVAKVLSLVFLNLHNIIDCDY